MTMRPQHREYAHDPRTNRGLINSLTKSWKDEQKQLKAASGNGSSKTKNKSYSGEFTAPPSAEGMPDHSSSAFNDSSAVPNTPNHQPGSEHQNGNLSKIQFSKNMRMQAINSAVRKVAEEASESQQQQQRKSSSKRKGMVRSVRKSVRNIGNMFKSNEDDGDPLTDDDENPHAVVSSAHFEDGSSSRRGRSLYPEQDADPADIIDGDATRRRTAASSRIRSKSEGLVSRKRRRSTEQRARRGNRSSISPARGSGGGGGGMRASTGSDNHHRLSGGAKTHRSERTIKLENEKLNKSENFNVPPQVSSALANAQAAKDIVSHAKRETILVQQSSERVIGSKEKADRSRSNHSTSQRLMGHNFDFSMSSLNDFPGVTALQQDGSMRNRSTRLGDALDLGDSNRKEIRHSTGSIPNNVIIEEVLNNSSNSFPPPSPRQERSSRGARKSNHHRSQHSKSRHTLSKNASLYLEDEIDASSTNSGDSELDDTSQDSSKHNNNHRGKKMSSSMRSPSEKNVKPKSSTDRLSKSQRRSGGSKLRSSGSARHHKRQHAEESEDVDKSQSHKRSSRSKRQQRSKMSASDRTHMRTSKLADEPSSRKSMHASATAKERPRNGSYGSLLFEPQTPVKSVHARVSLNQKDPVPDGDDREHHKRSKSMPRKGSKRNVKSENAEGEDDKKRRPVARKQKSSRRSKSNNPKERPQRRQASQEETKDANDEDESVSESVEWSRVNKALEVKKGLEEALNPGHQTNAALPELVPMATGLMQKMSLSDNKPTNSPKKEDISGLAKEMQKALNPTNQSNAALPNSGMEVVKGLLESATSDPEKAAEKTAAEPRSYHPRSALVETEEKEELSKSYHGPTEGKRSSSLPPKPSNGKSRSSTSKKKTRKSSAKEKVSKSSDQKVAKEAETKSSKDANGSSKDRRRDSHEESRGRKKKKPSDGQRSSSVTKRSASASQRKRHQQSSSQYKRTSTDESRVSMKDESRRSRHQSKKTDEGRVSSSKDERSHRHRSHSSSQYKRTSTDESSSHYKRSSTDESQRSRRSNGKTPVTHIDDMGFISNHEPAKDDKKKNVRAYGFQEDAIASFTESQSWYEFG